MDSISAFAKGQATRYNEQKVFDWEKAANMIKERGVTYASAGLSEDWEWTGGIILQEGKPVPREDTYTYLASTWATPVLEIDGDMIDCYRMKSEVPGWDSGTYWPNEAMVILTSNDK